jgi:hypothetical protein
LSAERRKKPRNKGKSCISLGEGIPLQGPKINKSRKAQAGALAALSLPSPYVKVTKTIWLIPAMASGGKRGLGSAFRASVVLSALTSFKARGT